MSLDNVGFLYEDLILLTSFKALSTNLTVKVVSFLESGNYMEVFNFVASTIILNLRKERPLLECHS